MPVREGYFMRQHQMYVVDTTPIYSNLHLFNQEQNIAELSQRPISFQKIKDYALKIIGGETL